MFATVAPFEIEAIVGSNSAIMLVRSQLVVAVWRRIVYSSVAVKCQGEIKPIKPRRKMIPNWAGGPGRPEECPLRVAADRIVHDPGPACRFSYQQGHY